MSESTVWSLGGFSLIKTFWPREPRRPFWRFCSQHHGPSPSSRPDQTCICGLAEHRIPHHIGRLFLLWMGQTKHKSGKKKKNLEIMHSFLLLLKWSCTLWVYFPALCMVWEVPRISVANFKTQTRGKSLSTLSDIKVSGPQRVQDSKAAERCRYSSSRMTFQACLLPSTTSVVLNNQAILC